MITFTDIDKNKMIVAIILLLQLSFAMEYIILTNETLYPAAEKISNIHPTRRRKKLRVRRKSQRDSIEAVTHSTARDGICSKIRKLLKPIAKPRIMRTPPIISPHSFMDRGRSSQRLRSL